MGKLFAFIFAVMIINAAKNYCKKSPQRKPRRDSPYPAPNPADTGRTGHSPAANEKPPQREKSSLEQLDDLDPDDLASLLLGELEAKIPSQPQKKPQIAQEAPVQLPPPLPKEEETAKQICNPAPPLSAASNPHRRRNSLRRAVILNEVLGRPRGYDI